MVKRGTNMGKDDLNVQAVPPELQNAVAITTLDKIYNWSRRNSLWPMMVGLAVA